MRLLVVSNMYPGARRRSFGVFVADRAAAYRDLGAEVRVAAITDPRKGWRVAVKYAGLLVRAAWLAVLYRPDVVEAHYLHPTGMIGAVAAVLGRARLVIHAHGSDVFDAPPSSRGERWAVRRAEEIHANSHATAEAVQARHPGATVETIAPGVDLTAFPASLEPRPAAVGFVGTLALYKGIDVFIESLALLTGAWRAEIAGDGPHARDVHTMIRRLSLDERVTVRGYIERDELSSFYRSLAVLVVPSRREAFGQVAVEALASGTPVVVTDVGGLAGIPTPDCGSVVPTEAPRATAQAIGSWLERRAESTAKSAAVERASQFDLALQARRALDRYEALAVVD